LAGLLHDIGKIGVREDVLMKAGKLTEEEYNNMKSHAVTGATILRPIAQFEDIIDCVMYHHERLDGSGYPEGLRGDAISLGAKILAVADAFDAMTSDRAYRPARPARAAVEELIRCKGVQFEPVVVDAFVEVIQTLQPAAV
jgi:putative nucleotidyltransferase with HDIG domain